MKNTLAQLDTGDPNSLISRLPDTLREYFESVNPHYFEKSEAELVLEVFGTSQPQDVCARFKISMWKEFHRVKGTPGKKMSTAAIYSGICTFHYFKRFIATDPGRLAFILTEPKDYHVEVEALLDLAVPEMFRIMQLPHQTNTKTGLIDTALLSLKFKIFQHMEARKHGAIAQNFKHDVNQKNLNLNADITPGTAPPNINDFNSLEEIENKIRELEKPRVRELPPAIDTLPTDYITIKTSAGPVEVLSSPELLNHGRPIKGGNG